METASIAKLNDQAVSSTLGLAVRNWFAVFTSSRHEKRVAQYLSQRDVEFFLPLYSAVHRWTNRCKVKVDLPLFPNYLFVNIERRQRTQVLGVPGVLSLVGSSQEPTPLAAADIESLRDGLQLRKVEPHPYLVVGERVRIKTGALAGMEGVLLRKKNDFRVVLSLDQIMKSIAVEVDAFDVEPAKSPFRSPSAT